MQARVEGGIQRLRRHPAGDLRVGLVVDELVGQQQVVVKSLEANYGSVDGIGGATILGNGRVALILDIAGLRERPSASRRTNTSTAATSTIQ